MEVNRHASLLFACDDTSVLYCNDDCLKFFREQVPGRNHLAAAQKAASRFPGYQVFPPTIHLLHACIFPDRLLPPGFPRGNDRAACNI